MDLGPVRSDICEVGRILYERGLIVAGDGNVSVRTSDNEMLITPSGTCKGRLEPAMLVRCDLNGNVSPDDASGLLPSSETKMHVQVYRDRPDVAAVVHAHPPVASAFAICRKPLEATYLPETVVNLGDVPVCDFALPSTDEVPQSIAPYTADHNALLLANHGAITWGANVWRALDLMETVEHVARVHAHVEALGGGVALTEEQIAQIRALY